MYRAGVPLESFKGENEEVISMVVQMDLKLSEYDYSKGKKLKKINLATEAQNPNTLNFLPPKGGYSLGNLPTRTTLWRFSEPFLWNNYDQILEQLKTLGLLNESDEYIM